MNKNGTLKLTPYHMDVIFVETLEAFKLSTTTIIHDYFNKGRLPPLPPPDQDKNCQYFLAKNQTPNSQKADEIESISKFIISPNEVEEIKTVYPMVFLGERGRM